MKLLLTYLSFMAVLACKPSAKSTSSLNSLSDEESAIVSIRASEGFSGGLFRVSGSGGSVICDNSAANSRCSDRFRKGTTVTLTAPENITILSSGQKMVFNKAIACSRLDGGGIIALDINDNSARFTISDDVACSASYKEFVESEVIGTFGDPTEVIGTFSDPTEVIGTFSDPTEVIGTFDDPTSATLSSTVSIEIERVPFDGDPIQIQGGGGLILCNYKNHNSCKSNFQRNSRLTMTVPEFITIGGASQLKFTGEVTCTDIDSGRVFTERLQRTVSFNANINMRCGARFEQVGTVDEPAPSVVSTPTPVTTPVVSTPTPPVANNGRKFTLSLGFDTSFQGAFTSSPAGINCTGFGSSGCSASFNENQEVVLTAPSTITLNNGTVLHFNGPWICNGFENPSGVSRSVSITMDRDWGCGAPYGER